MTKQQKKDLTEVIKLILSQLASKDKGERFILNNSRRISYTINQYYDRHGGKLKGSYYIDYTDTIKYFISSNSEILENFGIGPKSGGLGGFRYNNKPVYFSED